MGLRKIRIPSVDGLTAQLNQRVPFSAVQATKTDVENTNNESTVPSTKALNEFVSEINASISELQTGVDGIIDDTLDAANDKTWSIDKIRSFVASVDDTVVFGNISERDQFPNPYNTLIAYVLDTTGDSSLGTKEGQPAAYIYVDGNGWELLTPITQDIDLTPYVKKSDIVDNLTDGGTQVPLSAEQGKVLKGLVDQALNSTDAVMKVDSGLQITGDAFSTTYTPLGDIVGMEAEVEVSPGVYDVVDIAPSTDANATAKDFVILTDNSGEYDGKTCRVSYLKDVSE